MVSWLWNKKVSEKAFDDDELGDYFLSLYTDRSWIIRRVEHISMLDLSRVERRTSVDLDLRVLHERYMEVGLPKHGEILVPFGLLEKKPHLDFDVQANSGSPLQLLTSDQNSRFSRLMILASLRRSGCSEKVVASISEAVLDITGPTGREPSTPTSAWNQLCEALSDDERQQLEHLPEFRDLLETLFVSYLAIVRIPDSPLTSTTLKYRFIEDSGEWQPTLLERLGLQFPAMRIAGQIGYARSDHKIIETPPGLNVIGAVALADISDGSAFVPLEARQSIETRERFSPKQYVLHTKSSTQTRIKNLVEMTPSLGDFHFPALLSMSFTLVLVVSGLLVEWFGNHLSGLAEVSAVVTILALVPSILNVYLTIPGEHPVVARLFIFLRSLVFIASAATIIVAGIISIHLDHLTLMIALWVVSGYSLVTWLLILTSVLRAKGQKR